jgi:hypothetical protein
VGDRETAQEREREGGKEREREMSLGEAREEMRTENLPCYVGWIIRSSAWSRSWMKRSPLRRLHMSFHNRQSPLGIATAGEDGIFSLLCYTTAIGSGRVQARTHAHTHKHADKQTNKQTNTQTHTHTHTHADTTGDARLPQSLQGRKHSLALTAGFGDALPIRSSLLLNSLFSLSPITYLGSMLRARSINGCCCSCPPLSPKTRPRSLSSRSTKPHAGILQQQEDDMTWKELSQLIRQQEKST